VTGYAVRPARVRKEKPRVAAFTSANTDKILALKPDLVLAFSDLQADIAADLIRHGIAVHCFNQRCVEGIFDMVLTLGALVDARDEAAVLVAGWREKIAALEAAVPDVRPRVYFEEWDEPLITGIGWVSELIEVAGGEDCFAHLRTRQAAKDRIITSHDVISAAPDIIIGSWCGKKFRPDKVAARPGVGGDTGGARRAAARDQVAIDIAAGAGGAERRARPPGDDHHIAGNAEGCSFTLRSGAVQASCFSMDTVIGMNTGQQFWRQKMFKFVTPALVAAALMAGASTLTSTPAQASDGIAGNYFAIGGCFQSRSAARKRARRLGAEVVRTDDYPNFRAGWWCAVQGPYIRDEANYWRGEFRRRGVGDAYVKSGW
jgi:iron complex transport system substrate-binding protein